MTPRGSGWRARVVRFPVRMAQIAGRIEAVPHALLQGLRVREAPVALAVPQHVAVVGDLEHPARARDKRDLVRIVRTPSGQLNIDETGRLAGRGAYLCRDAACWTTALERGTLGRALDTPITADLREAMTAHAAQLTTTEGGQSGKE